MANIKKRNWAFVLYPESAPADWKDQLQLLGLSCAISPLHDKDLNATGEPKKAHYHIILCFGSPTTYNNVLAITKIFNATIPQPLESVRGMYRYLTHKDNPEKVQYDEKDIILLNDFDVADVLNSGEVFHIMKMIDVLIENLKLFEYSDLMKYLRDNEMNDYYNVAASHTLFFNTLISSYRNKAVALAKKEQMRLTITHEKSKNETSDNVCYVNFYKLEIKYYYIPY